MIAPAEIFEPKLLVNSDAAADMLSISVRTLARITEPHGTLRAVRIGSAKKPILRYRVADLEAWIEQQCTNQRHDSDGESAVVRILETSSNPRMTNSASAAGGKV